MRCEAAGVKPTCGRAYSRLLTTEVRQILRRKQSGRPR